MPSLLKDDDISETSEIAVGLLCTAGNELRGSFLCSVHLQ